MGIFGWPEIGPLSCQSDIISALTLSCARLLLTHTKKDDAVSDCPNAGKSSSVNGSLVTSMGQSYQLA
jgi:hypothetical protein